MVRDGLFEHFQHLDGYEKLTAESSAQAIAAVNKVQDCAHKNLYVQCITYYVVFSANFIHTSFDHFFLIATTDLKCKIKVNLKET